MLRVKLQYRALNLDCCLMDCLMDIQKHWVDCTSHENNAKTMRRRGSTRDTLPEVTKPKGKHPTQSSWWSTLLEWVLRLTDGGGQIGR